jgi:xylulokinase
MTKRYLIGVDLGTSGTKAALYHLDGKKIADASREVPLHYPAPGIVEQENEDFYDTAVQTIRACVESSGVDPREIGAIAFDSQMAGVGLVNEDFNPAARFDSWLDMRCQPYIELMARECGDRITELTGCPPTCDHGPKMLWWKHERPQTYADTAKFVMPGTFVAGRMANLKADQAFIDYTYIHFSGFSDARNGKWSEELCTRFDLDAAKLPRIVDPWEVVGEVSEQAAKDCGLAAGTPIAAGAGDTAANALGAGIVAPGMVFDVAGTAAVLACSTDRFVADTKNKALLTMRSVIPGLWNPLAYIAGGGIALRWFRDTFYNAHKGQTLPADGDLYEEMIATAKDIPAGSDGLFFSPHLGGRICPSSASMRGAWVGASWAHRQAHFFRAILESVAYEYAYYLSILRELIPDLSITQARAVGGGARSREWNRIKASVLGVPYQKLNGNEFGTWGAAMIAGKSVGMINDLADHALKTAVVEGDPLNPNPQDQTVYAPLVARYIRLQGLLNTFFTENSNTGVVN